MANGKRIIAGVEDAIAFARGDRSRGRESKVAIPKRIDVRAIRRKLEMTQEEFAARFAIPLNTLRNWEQGARQPEGATRVLLILIDRIPQQIEEALRAA
jgi:putative transcriptional regulator